MNAHMFFAVGSVPQPHLGCGARLCTTGKEVILVTKE